MPTRSTLVLLFLFLVAVPVGAAVYLGTVGLGRERTMLVDRERQAMARRADEVRDALVRVLQGLYRREQELDPAAYRPADEESREPVQSRFQVLPDAQAEEVPPEVLEADAQTVVIRDDTLFRNVKLADGRSLVVGGRIDPQQIERRYLDPASPYAVVPRFDGRIERVRLVHDDERLRSVPRGPYGLPLAFYRYVIPAGPNPAPVLLPAGYVLEIGMRPAASLARDLEEAERQLVWVLGAVGVVIVLGLLFAWRAVHAEARLASRKAEFVSAVSHELRTPLTSIRMYADMLKEGWVKDEATAQDYFALLSAESERLARLVNNVLDFSRIEKGGKAFEMQVGDPAPVVRDVAEVLRPYLKEKGFELHLEVPETLPACEFDKDALAQILVNLIDNAVKYGAGEVRVQAAAEDGSVVLRVLDRGPGVPAEEREEIFEPFARGRGENRGGGTGLGLALVRHYANAHRGRVEVADRDGGGAVFALTLPAAG